MKSNISQKFFNNEIEKRLSNISVMKRLVGERSYKENGNEYYRSYSETYKGYEYYIYTVTPLKNPNKDWYELILDNGYNLGKFNDYHKAMDVAKKHIDKQIEKKDM